MAKKNLCCYMNIAKQEIVKTNDKKERLQKDLF